MIYLFLQTWAWILGAFILGLIFGWWLCGRCCCTGNKDSKTEAPSKVATSKKKAAAASAATLKASEEVIDVKDDWKPAGLTAKPGEVDDLKQIKGIGPVIEKTLHGLGIYQFQQVADFTEDNIAWVDNHISFPGRIQREDWVGQAKKIVS